MKYKLFTPLLLIAPFLALAPTAKASTTWYVNGVSGSDSNICTSTQTACKTIGHAISQASSGDSIIVAPATYTENLVIVISLNVIGSGARTTIIDGRGTQTVVAISNGTNVTLAGLTIRNGFVSWQSGGKGAGIYNSGYLVVTNSTITGNVSSVSCQGRFPICSVAAGGGIYNSAGAQLTIRQSTVNNNSAYKQCLSNPCGAAADGGGIYNAGVLIVSDSTLAGNSVLYAGGLVHWGRGGGISNYYNGTVTISNSTISGNAAQSIGGGIYSYGGHVTIQNTVLSNNTGSNCGGVLTSTGYNLSSDSTCNFSSGGDFNNRDPLLGPLQNNGGTTDTMALLPGSPAIDAGNPAGCTDGQGHLLNTDQRGMPRPDSEDTSGCDMGAYESQSD